jgi:CRP/FNR family transcriptional regulator, cyclic AMP receptor protein
MMHLHSQSRGLRDCLHCEFRSLRMFCNLHDEALTHFNSLGVPVSRSSGAKLYREGEEGDAVYVVCSGQIKLSCTSKEGKTLMLKIAMPGDVLGLSAAITGSPYEVTAEAMETAELKAIGRRDFLEFLQRHGEASLHSAKLLSKEYKDAFFDARRLALSSSVPGRLASVLLEWGRAASCGKPEMKFNMRLTHEELANMIGTSRETVTRALNRFRRDGLIEIRGVSVLITSPEKLERFTS